MAETSQVPVPWDPGSPAGARTSGYRVSSGGSLLAFVAVLAGGPSLGLACGLLWAALATRTAFVVVSRGQADLVYPETSAFIAADAWYVLIALGGGAVLGLLGYRLAVRRYGPLPMAGVVLGSVAAAFAARWSGQSVGIAAFNGRLAASRPGTLIEAPVVLGAHSAMAFWPLAACVVAGGLQALAVMRARSAAAAGQVTAYPGTPPGMTYPAAGPPRHGCPAAGQPRRPYPAEPAGHGFPAEPGGGFPAEPGGGFPGRPPGGGFPAEPPGTHGA